MMSGGLPRKEGKRGRRGRVGSEPQVVGLSTLSASSKMPWIAFFESILDIQSLTTDYLLGPERRDDEENDDPEHILD